MSFNQGWLCPNCGPVPESKKRSIKKIQYNCCKHCDAIVGPWERPLNEREGHCGNCGNASFILAMGKKMLAGHLLRMCKKCQEVYDTDSEIVRKPGKEIFKYEQSKK